MPDFNLKLPNFTAEISCSCTISDSIDDVDFVDDIVKIALI